MNNMLKIRKVSNEVLQLTLKCHSKLIRKVREHVGEFARRNGFSDDEINDIELAVNEAIVNVLEHAYLWDENGDLDLTVEMHDEQGELMIVIRDFGKKANPISFKSRKLEVLQEHGLGVFFIYNLMYEFVYDHTHGNGTS